LAHQTDFCANYGGLCPPVACADFAGTGEKKGDQYMKPFWIFTVVFLVVGICSVAAQDMIVLEDGNLIEAKVVEISPTEIRYKRFDHLDGPTIAIPVDNVLSIRYENGTYEVFNAGATPQQESIQQEGTQQEINQAEEPKSTALDPNKFIFGINANAGGAIGYALGSTGAGINLEFGKGRFNTEINLMIPNGGFGALITFNGFWPSQLGGAYLGGGIGFSTYRALDKYWGDYYTARSFTVGLNLGYKFLTKTGLYFRTGGFFGYDFGMLWDPDILPVFIKPDLAVGWLIK
jgi:hypothetical protein